MLRVGILGCGKIADQHAAVIQRISGCEFAAACDAEELMARQLADRYGVKKWFNDVPEFIDAMGGGVVHITTPPQSHFSLGKSCLESGCHVYMEKPFTLNAREAEHLTRLAEQKKLKITVGHNAQFTHAAIRMRELVREGFLGGQPVHMESYYCYNLAGESYAKALLGDKGHWVRRLPGRLLHNIISHGISKVVEFLITDKPKTQAFGFTSPMLRKMGETDIVDELRVFIYDGDASTAYFTFSSQMRPSLHQLRLYGRKNGLIVDDDHETLIRVRGAKYKSYLEQFVPPCELGRQYVANGMRNLGRFLKRELHVSFGMKYLMSAFYGSVVEDAPLPIPHREIVLTARVMDEIFEQLNHNGTDSTLPGWRAPRGG